MSFCLDCITQKDHNHAIPIPADLYRRLRDCVEDVQTVSNDTEFTVEEAAQIAIEIYLEDHRIAKEHGFSLVK